MHGVSHAAARHLMVAHLLQVAREIRIHMELHHPSIISMYAAWSDTSYVYIAMEWAPEVGGQGHVAEMTG
jgi:serine/threonine protein kinase